MNQNNQKTAAASSPEVTARNPVAKTVQFLSYHQPALKSGEYTISVVQKVTVPGPNNKPIDYIFNPKKPLSVNVTGEQFLLKPADFQNVFPPPNSTGFHDNVLPHVALTRSTLPWERLPIYTSKSSSSESSTPLAPWLALLVFHETEKVPTPQIVQLKDALPTLLKTKTSWVSAYAYPDDWCKNPAVYIQQQPTDKVTVIDVDPTLLEAILPTFKELSWMAHVRRPLGDDDNLTGNETAFIFANRLPLSQGKSTVHLVSLENCFNTDTEPKFIALTKPLKKNIRLISLKSWSFTCKEPSQTFGGLLKNLKMVPSTLRLPDLPPEADKTQQTQQAANAWLQMGGVPLPHFMREGQSTVSWFHGPLSPNSKTVSSVLSTIPSHAADPLLIYDAEIGMFDVSYAAAWEMGRQLCLQSKATSIGLYHWKCQQAQNTKQTEQATKNLYPLLTTVSKAEPHDKNDQLVKWFYGLSLLKGVPFNYLVPDEKMLPPESIRFFKKDDAWIQCLLDGAFSIGRVSSSAHDLDCQLRDKINTYGKGKQWQSGFLLRSAVVSGWPGLHVNAYDTIYKDTISHFKNLILITVRQERLSANVLICLFEGEVKTVDFYLKPETLHFGVNHKCITKKNVRYRDGSEPNPAVSFSVPFKNKVGYPLVIDMVECKSKLAKVIPNAAQSSINPAIFGMEMIQAGDLIRIHLDKSLI